MRVWDGLQEGPGGSRPDLAQNLNFVKRSWRENVPFLDVLREGSGRGPGRIRDGSRRRGCTPMAISRKCCVP